MGQGSKVDFLPGFVTSRRVRAQPKRPPNPPSRQAGQGGGASSSRASSVKNEQHVTDHSRRRHGQNSGNDEERLRDRSEQAKEWERIQEEARQSSQRRREEAELAKQKEEEEEQRRQRERKREAEEQKKAAKVRDENRKKNLVGVFAVQEDEDDDDREKRAHEKREIEMRKRSLGSTLAAPLEARERQPAGRVPAHDAPISDVFCNPSVAAQADPGVIAAHAMRFMELKRRFRSKELGGPGRDGRHRSRSRSRLRNYRRD